MGCLTLVLTVHHLGRQMCQSPSMLFVFLQLVFLQLVTGFECDPDSALCETSLNIHHRLPMMTKYDGPVYPFKGKLYKYDVTNTSNVDPVDAHDVITADSYEDSLRLVITVNDTFPGPPIIVYEGQHVVLHVNNHLHSEAITVHFHGLAQEGTPWMDGVPFITQCPILPGQTFTHRFQVRHAGTFWYHSHMAFQRVNGLYGPFIVRKKTSNLLPEHIVQISEWNHENDANVDHAMKIANGVYRGRKLMPRSEQLDRIRVAVYNYHSGLINGRGRFWKNSTVHNEGVLQTFEVIHGEKYRFRIIGAGAFFSWRISVDNHNITIVGSDGFEIEPLVVESLIISPGERYDFILEANQPIGNYWIRGISLDRKLPKLAEGILHYHGAPESDPMTQRKSCSKDDPCLVVNCPFAFYPENEGVKCIHLTQMKALLNIQTPVAPLSKFKEIFLNFGFPGMNGSLGQPAVNGRQFTNPRVSALSQPLEIDNHCTDKECGEGKLCKCFHALTVNMGEIIQMTLASIGEGRGDNHPIHLHGHSFFVIKQGHGVYSENTGAFIRDTDDIVCNDVFCNNATWRNASWGGGNIPGIVSKGALIKDTVIVPAGGYVVIRFPATNPGVWILHCHVDLHSEDGMALVLNETFSRIPHAPKGFPECKNFD